MKPKGVTTQMKALDKCFLMVVFTFLLSRVHVFASLCWIWTEKRGSHSCEWVILNHCIEDVDRIVKLLINPASVVSHVCPNKVTILSYFRSRPRSREACYDNMVEFIRIESKMVNTEKCGWVETAYQQARRDFPLRSIHRMGICSRPKLSGKRFKIRLWYGNCNVNLENDGFPDSK